MKRSTKKEARRKRNNLIAGLVMLFVMLFSIIAFSIDSTFQSQGSFDFNDFTFRQKTVFDNKLYGQDIWKYYTFINGDEVEFYFTPQSMTQVNVSQSNLSAISSASRVLFTRRPVEQNDEFNINVLFFDVLVSEYDEFSRKIVGYGLLEHNVFESDLPLITCEFASSSDFVIILSNFSISPSIREVEPYCFEISGSGESMLQVSDYLLYKTHGVI